MLRTILKFLLISELFAITTFGLGWWSVPIVATILGLIMDRNGNGVAWATWCATAGWVELLAVAAARAPIGQVANRLGGVFHIPAVALLAVTIAFAALLAWCGATLGTVVRGRQPSRIESTVRPEPTAAASPIAGAPAA